MKPGPDLVYKCSKCERLTKRGSLVSGNTIGAKLYNVYNNENELQLLKIKLWWTFNNRIRENESQNKEQRTNSKAREINILTLLLAI